MEKSGKKRVLQTELTFHLPTERKPEGIPDGRPLCPVYYPQTGEALQNLARRLSPVLARTGWRVRIVEGEEGGFLLELQNKDGRVRRLSPDETLAWQALLPQLATPENLLSKIGSTDRKDG